MDILSTNSCIRIMIIAAWLAAPAALAAQEACHHIQDDTDRLACYDLETGRVASEGAPVEDFGKWRVHNARSEMTDFRNVFFTLDSENEINHRYAHQRGTGRARLTARCRDNSTAVIIGMDNKFLADTGGFGRVEVRLDDKPARSYRMNESTDNMALGLWQGAGIPFLKAARGSETLRMEITPFNDSPQVMKFDIRGIDAVVSTIRDRCSW